MRALDRSTPPPFQLSADYTLTLPEVFSLGSGIQLFAFRGLHQEAVKLELIYNAGKWHEQKIGVSHFTSQMLAKGTDKRNSFQVAEALDSLGAHLEISPGFDVVSVALFSLRKNLLAAFRIVMELLESPAFDDAELRLMKEIFIQGLRVNNEKTSVVASKEIRKVIFGNSHPYGSSIEENDVSLIAKEDLYGFFKYRYFLQSAFLVGRLTDEEIRDLLKIIPACVPRKDEGVQAVESVAGISHRLARPERVQASLRIGKKCPPKRDNNGYFDALMFNHLLGGFFGSRLMKNIREEKGLTYGIYSSMHHFLHDGFWVIGAEVNQQNAVSALEEIKKEINKLTQEPVPLAELEIAINYFTGSWQSENSTLFSVAEKFKNIKLWGLPDSYYTHMLEHIQHITPDQILRAGQAHFGTDGLFEIQVG